MVHKTMCTTLKHDSHHPDCNGHTLNTAMPTTLKHANSHPDSNGHMLNTAMLTTLKHANSHPDSKWHIHIEHGSVYSPETMELVSQLNAPSLFVFTVFYYIELEEGKEGRTSSRSVKSYFESE